MLKYIVLNDIFTGLIHPSSFLGEKGEKIVEDKSKD